MTNFEVPEPIRSSPFEEPPDHWFLREGEPPALRTGRRPALVFPPEESRREWNLSDGVLRRSRDYAPAFEMVLVNRIREAVRRWRLGEGVERYAGTGRVTRELLEYWRRDGRETPLFFAQLEAAETIIFLNEGPAHLLQGIQVPLEVLSDREREAGKQAFRRLACKMATGSGKTTVMGMLAAWSILNKVNAANDSRFSDVVLIVCPNVTIRERLAELDPQRGEASLYRTRDLVPPDYMDDLRRGRVVVTNWHPFEPKVEGDRVSKRGVRQEVTQTIQIGAKTTTARGWRYLTEEDLNLQAAAGLLEVLEEKRDRQGVLRSVKVRSVRYVQSDASLVEGILKGVGGKQNILVFNDEAHHAYRIRQEEPEDDQPSLLGDDEDDDEYFREATVWIEGLDKINRLRGINFCVDLSATPYFLGRVGQDANKPFPWVVSDFSLSDAIESGLVKIPQLVVRDTTGAAVGGYFNIWAWILPQLTPRERGTGRTEPKPEAILKYAHTPIAMLGSYWQEELRTWRREREDPRPPVLIVVCKTTKLAQVVFDWLANDVRPAGIPSANLPELQNLEGETRTIRVDSKVVRDSDSGNSQSDETAWMRFTLDTVGRLDWPRDRQGRAIYPEKFAALAEKLGRPLSPPGRDIRCIVSVGMLTEGWDCNTVTHILGLRPFMSQLLCEQVVGRGLRRVSYDLTEDDKFPEEIARVFGVPFRIVPYQADGKAEAPPQKRRHVFAVPEKAEFEIRFPRVDGYARAIRNRVTANWERVPRLLLDPARIPPEVETAAALPNNSGRPSVSGVGRIEDLTLNPYRASFREQRAVFDLAATITRDFAAQAGCDVPVHVLFPQVVRIVERFLAEQVQVIKPAELVDVMCSPYYGWVIERLVEAIHGDQTAGEAPEIARYETHRGPGTTADVSFWTSRELRQVARCHLNWIVCDSGLEERTVFAIDKSEHVLAFVKTDSLGFEIPYFHNGQMNDYRPDFIIRLADGLHLILETKGWDPLEQIKREAAERWCDAVTAEGSFGRWVYRVCRRPDEVRAAIAEVALSALHA